MTQEETNEYLGGLTLDVVDCLKGAQLHDVIAVCSAAMCVAMARATDQERIRALDMLMDFVEIAMPERKPKNRKGTMQ